MYHLLAYCLPIVVFTLRLKLILTLLLFFNTEWWLPSLNFHFIVSHNVDLKDLIISDSISACCISIVSNYFQINSCKRGMTALDIARSQGKNDVASILMQVSMPWRLCSNFCRFRFSLLSLHPNLAPTLCSCCERGFTADRKYSVLAICWRRAVCPRISR